MHFQPVVYIVEDDNTSRMLMEHHVQNAQLPHEAFNSAQAFWDAHGAHCADLRGCLLLDIHMPGMDGLDLQQRLGDAGATLPILIVTGTADVHAAVMALKHGAADLLEKPVNATSLLDAAREAIARDTANFERRQAHQKIVARLAQLSAREREVMDLVVEGLANKQIAMRLGLSEKTVEAHRGRVMRKTESDSVAELVKLSVAYQHRE